MVPDYFTPRIYLASLISFIPNTEDNHCLVALIISKLFLARSMSSTYRVMNMIPLVVLLTYTQWSSKIIVKPKEVMDSYNLKCHDLKDCFRPYMDLLR